MNSEGLTDETRKQFIQLSTQHGCTEDEMIRELIYVFVKAHENRPCLDIWGETLKTLLLPEQAALCKSLI